MNGRLLPATFTLIGATAIITIALPAGHELGHYMVARALDVPVEGATWTLLERTPPSVRYRDAGVSAQAWIAAGGMLLPTAVGVLLLLLWLRFSIRVPSQVRILWLMLGYGCVLNGVGPALDLATGRFSHLSAGSGFTTRDCVKTCDWRSTSYMHPPSRHTNNGPLAFAVVSRNDGLIDEAGANVEYAPINR